MHDRIQASLQCNQVEVARPFEAADSLLDVVCPSCGKGEFGGMGSHSPHTLFVVSQGSHSLRAHASDIPHLHRLVMGTSDHLQQCTAHRASLQ